MYQFCSSAQLNLPSLKRSQKVLKRTQILLHFETCQLQLLGTNAFSRSQDYLKSDSFLILKAAEICSKLPSYISSILSIRWEYSCFFMSQWEEKKNNNKKLAIPVESLSMYVCIYLIINQTDILTPGITYNSYFHGQFLTK